MKEINQVQNSQKNIPPSNLEAEQALLGSILVNNDIIDEVSSIVSSSIFYDPAHVKIYEVIENLNNKGMIANPITLKNFFEKDNMLGEVGGTEYLVKLTRFSGSTKQAVDYAKIIHEMYLRRELISISEKLSYDTLNANTQEQNAENIIESTEKSLFNLAERGSFSQSFIEFKKAIDKTIEMATLAMQSDRGVVGVPTGLTDLDEKLGGLHKSDLIILAGRPSMGKTAFAVNMVEHAVMTGGAVLVFSMEMPSEQILMRMLSSLGRIDQTRMRTGDLKDEDWTRFASAVSQLKDKRLYIDDTAALTPAEVRSRARRVARETGGLDMIMVDYLQLMRTAKDSENRATEISEISRALKALAKEMGFSWFRTKETDRWDTYTKNLGLMPTEDYQPPSYGRNVVCEKDRDSSVFLDYTGKYWPCCHMAEAFLNKVGMELHSDIRDYDNIELFKEYKARLVTDTPFYICRRACGTKGKRSQWKTEVQLR